jgi:hypothetical protein
MFREDIGNYQAASGITIQGEMPVKVGPYRVNIRLSTLIVPGLCMGYGLYQYLNVRQLPNKINLVLIEPVFVLMVFFTLWVLAREINIRREMSGEEELEPSKPIVRKRRLSASAGKMVAFALLSGLYLALVQPVGFILCNMAFLLAAMLLLGVRRRSVLIILPPAATGAIYLFFQVWMDVPIPAGLLDFLL